MVEIRPIELDASLLFYNKKSGQSIPIPMNKIRDVRVVHHERGRFRKTTDLMMKITFPDILKEQ